MRVLLVLLGVLLVASCQKVNGPLKLYFIGSSRFTTGTKAVGPADTLATNLYALTDNKDSHLTKFTATVTYSPQQAPFAYPVPITSLLALPAADPTVTYLDSTLTGSDFLFTPVFGTRTTAGTERWDFTVRDNNGTTVVRSFVLAVRRADSLKIYNDYTLKLRVPASRATDRRFIDLKSGLALPAYSLLGTLTNPTLQQLTDVIVLPNGLGLASPDTVGFLTTLSQARWPDAKRSKTRFRLTPLLPADFTGAQDTSTIRNAFTGQGRAYIRTLAKGQVYAFRATNNKATGGLPGPPVYGLMQVLSLPDGTTTTGLQLQIRLAKQRL